MAAPDLGSVLSLRLSAEQSRLDDVRAMLSFAVPAGSPESISLGNRLDEAARVVSSVRRDVARDAMPAWEAWAEQSKDADPLVDQIISMLMTRLLRQSGVDHGVFDTAEALLTELSRAAGVPPVVIAQTQDVESVDHLRSAVSMRFPGARIWGLPVLVHEFGHHLVAHLRHREPALADRRPLRDVVSNAARQPGQETFGTEHAHELLADAVATVILGPTYPIACLCLRVPSTADRPYVSRGSTHPAWTRRVAAMRATLDELSLQTGHSRFRSQRETVIDPLTTTVLGGLDGSGDVEALIAEGAVKAIRQHRPNLTYDGADVAIALADRLAAGVAEPVEKMTVTTIIDAAWRWRLAHAQPDDDVVGTIVAWCKAAARGGEQP